MWKMWHFSQTILEFKKDFANVEISFNNKSFIQQLRFFTKTNEKLIIVIVNATSIVILEYHKNVIVDRKTKNQKSETVFQKIFLFLRF